MSASPAPKLPRPSASERSGPTRLSPSACPFCKGAGEVHYREKVGASQRDPRTGRGATEGVEPCEAGAGWPGLLYGGPLPGNAVRETARVYHLHPPRFALGLLVATPGALALARAHGVDLLALLRRHRAGDWGAVGRDDALANDLALDPACPARLLSAYDVPASGGRPGGRLWVVTEADRSATTVLLPPEY